MFNIGFFELIILGVIGLVVLGPEELPQMARKAARLLNEFKRMGEGIISPVENFKSEADRFLEKTKHDIVADVLNKKNIILEEKLKVDPDAKSESQNADSKTVVDHDLTSVAKKD